MPNKGRAWLKWLLVGLGSLLAVGLVIGATFWLTHRWTGSPTDEATANPSAPSRAEQILAGLTLEAKIGQLFVVDTANLAVGQRGGASNIDASDDATAINQAQIEGLAKYQPGGVVFFGGNVQNAAQVRQYTADLQAQSQLGLLIATDQEGGSVDRLSRAGVSKFPNMATIGATGDPDRAREVGETFGREMKPLGFNLNFAPVADVNTNPDNPAIGVRSFGSDPELVARMVEAEVQGLQSNIAATLKHFPGHGDTSTDTHTGMAVVEHDLARLRAIELVPFRAGIAAGADLVLTAHIKLPQVDPSGMPATMSKTVVTDLLRGEMGFQGVVITDALDMAAISDYYSPAEVAENCLNAGVDLLLMPKYYYQTYDALLQLVRDGKISEDRINQSVLRVLNLKLRYGVIE